MHPRKMLIEAIRYGDDPEVRARLEQAVENAIDQERIRGLLEKQSLVTTAMDTGQIMRIREDMERASARRLQPHYIKSFFVEAFERLGGATHERENGRYTINNVPAVIRNWAKDRGLGAISSKYERICFEKSLINVPEKPPAAFICPGHPLLDATIGLLLERERDALKRGAMLVDETDPGREPRALFYLEQAIQDATPTKTGDRCVISREVHFVEIGATGTVNEAGGAPYLDYRPASEGEIAQLQPLLEQEWLKGESLERQATAHAVETLVPRHLERVRKRRIELIDKTEAAVQERLTKEINYWDRRTAELRAQEQAGRVNARLNSARAQERADRLADRLKQRKDQLAQERQISAAPPIIIGGALIIPIGLLLGDKTPTEVLDRSITEQIAMHAVTETEIALGNDPRDVSVHDFGYDIESRDGDSGRIRFIEVKGRRTGAETVTITRNEILTALNSPDAFILALVEIDGDKAVSPRYIRQPFTREPDFWVTSVNYNIKQLLEMSEAAR